MRSLSWEDPLEQENGKLLQHSCLENSMDRGAWFAKLNMTEQMGTYTQWCQNKENDQLDSTENEEIESCIYGQLILSKDTKEIQWKKG